MSDTTTRKSYGRILTTKTKDLGHGIVECIVSTNALDRHGERLDIKGLNTKNYSGVVFINHDYGMLPVGKSLGLRKTADGKLISKTQFAVDEWDVAATAYKLVKGGYMPDVSIGFIPKEFDADTNTWTKSDMIEYSHVGIGANPEAKVIKGLKNIGMDMAEFKAQVKAYKQDNPELAVEAKGAVADALNAKDKYEYLDPFWEVVYAFTEAYTAKDVLATDFGTLLTEAIGILQTVADGTYESHEDDSVEPSLMGMKLDPETLAKLKSIFDKDTKEEDVVLQHIASAKSVLTAAENELKSELHDTVSSPEQQRVQKRITLVRAQKAVQTADRLTELTLVAIKSKLNNKE